MIVNAATCNKISKLLAPKIRQTVNSGEKILGEHGLSVFVPNNAATCDIIHGIGKKGEYQLFSFKNANGKTIQHYTRYFKDNSQYTDVITDIDNLTNKGAGLFNMTRKTTNGILKGKNNIEKIEHSSMLCFPYNDKKMAQKSFMTLTPNGDFGGQEILRQDKKPAGFKFKYNWDGKPMQIEYKNTFGQKLDLTDAERQYLPFSNRRLIFVEQNGQYVIGSQDFTTERVAEKFNLAQKIQEKFHGLKDDLLPRAKAVKQDDLVTIKMQGKTAKELEKEGKFIPYGEALPNGQINIAIDVPYGTDGVYIFDKIAHEMQHEADLVIMNSGGDEACNEALQNIGKTLEEIIVKLGNQREFYDNTEFVQKCITQNGLFKKGTPEYKKAVKLWEMNLNTESIQNLKDEASHDAMDFEGRAIKTQKQQMDIINQISLKISNLLNQLIC